MQMPLVRALAVINNTLTLRRMALDGDINPWQTWKSTGTGRSTIITQKKRLCQECDAVL
jgi:hypothetical protein